MTALKKVKSCADLVDCLKMLPFYNKHIEKPKIKRLKNIDLLSDLPFYKELNVIKANHAFRRYAMTYKDEINEKKDPVKQLEISKSSIKDLFPVKQLEASKSSIKDLFSDHLNETKCLKYQIALKVMLKKMQT